MININTARQNIPKGRIQRLKNNISLKKASQAPRETVNTRQIKIKIDKPNNRSLVNLNLRILKK